MSGATAADRKRASSVMSCPRNEVSSLPSDPISSTALSRAFIIATTLDLIASFSLLVPAASYPLAVRAI